MNQLYIEWINAKDAEEAATAKRRHIENIIISEQDISAELDGVKNIIDPDFKIKITGRLNRKIDANLMTEIASTHGLMDYTTSLFRWKPELNAAAWKVTEKTITDIFLPAITTTPGRPSFSIEIIQQKEQE